MFALMTTTKLNANYLHKLNIKLLALHNFLHFLKRFDQSIQSSNVVCVAFFLNVIKVLWKFLLCIYLKKKTQTKHAPFS